MCVLTHAHSLRTAGSGNTKETKQLLMMDGKVYNGFVL